MAGNYKNRRQMQRLRDRRQSELKQRCTIKTGEGPEEDAEEK